MSARDFLVCFRSAAPGADQPKNGQSKGRRISRGIRRVDACHVVDAASDERAEVGTAGRWQKGRRRLVAGGPDADGMGSNAVVVGVGTRQSGWG